MEINETLTKRVAELARIRLSSEELSSFTKQLGDILGYVEQINALELDSAVQVADSPVAPFRPDVVVAPVPGDDGLPKVLESAPQLQEGAFQVPQIV